MTDRQRRQHIRRMLAAGYTRQGYCRDYKITLKEYCRVMYWRPANERRRAG